MKIYVASSWRNEHQPSVVKVLRDAQHEVYDFRNPRPGDKGFAWSEIDPKWKEWSAAAFREALAHPIANRGFDFDMNALIWCDACVLVLPCGRSAHLELGWACGAKKWTIAYAPEGEKHEPELMYKMLDKVCLNTDDVVKTLAYWDRLLR